MAKWVLGGFYIWGSCLDETITEADLRCRTVKVPENLCMCIKGGEGSILTDKRICCQEEKRMYDIIIAGAGPAGLSAAIYGVRAGKKVLLLEANVYGGQIMSASDVENYPGILRITGYELAENLCRQAKDLGAELKYEKVLGIREKEGVKCVQTSRSEYDCRSVILDTSTRNRRLQVEREEELTGSGISYCAVCDGAFYRGKDTAVVGGGNTALEDAVFLSEYCRTVYLIHRRAKFRGEESLAEVLRAKENIQFILESQVVCLNGTSHLQSILIKDNHTGGTRELFVSALFIAVGQEPDNRAFSNLVALDVHGYIRAAEDCLTSAKGVFTAGDCRTKQVRQLTTAAADGAAAALAACSYLNKLTAAPA